MTARWAVRAASASPAGEGESFFGNQKIHLPLGGCIFLFKKGFGLSACNPPQHIKPLRRLR